VTFLHLDDLIVYQAMANIIADKFRKQRKQVSFEYVFSNVFNSDDREDIFFFKKWQECYRSFVKKIKK